MWLSVWVEKEKQRNDLWTIKKGLFSHRVFTFHLNITWVAAGAGRAALKALLEDWQQQQPQNISKKYKRIN